MHLNDIRCQQTPFVISLCWSNYNIHFAFFAVDITRLFRFSISNRLHRYRPFNRIKMANSTRKPRPEKRENKNSGYIYIQSLWWSLSLTATEGKVTSIETRKMQLHGVCVCVWLAEWNGEAEAIVDLPRFGPPFFFVLAFQSGHRKGHTMEVCSISWLPHRIVRVCTTRHPAIGHSPQRTLNVNAWMMRLLDEQNVCI